MALNFFLIRCLFGVVVILSKVACIQVLSELMDDESNTVAEQPSTKSTVLHANTAHAMQDSSWRLLKEEDSIKVFVKDNPNGYKSVRMELTIHGSLASLRERLQDVDGYTDWVYRCVSATQRSAPGDSSLIYRVITDFPFPFKDRELTVRSLQKVDTDGTFYSRSSAIPSADTDGQYAIIHHFESRWKVKPVTPGNLHVVYEVTTEPGGEIPAWLYNMAVDRGPLHTMKRLKALVEEKSVVDHSM